MYERLSDPELLKGCLERKTQNANESIHAMIWNLCPKHSFVQRQRFEIGVAVAVAEYNMGAEGTHLFLEKVGLQMNAQTVRQGVKRDVERVRKAEHAVKVDVKRRRMIVRDARAQEEKRLERVEGGPQYVGF